MPASELSYIDPYLSPELANVVPKTFCGETVPLLYGLGLPRDGDILNILDMSRF
jgi:hypothetical protein